MCHAEDDEGEVEELLRAAAGSLDVVRELGRDHRDPAVRHDEERVRHERDSAVAVEEERVLGRAGAGCEDGAEPTREHVSLGVAPVGLLLDLLRQRRRVHFDAELPAEPPGGALVIAGRQANRGDLSELAERRVGERQGIDEHRSLV